MASLVVVAGPAQGTHFALAQHRVVSVGRDDQCTFQVVDPAVSRQHMRVRFDEATQRHSAGDYRSANGVIVNGKRITGDAPLNEGDEIQIGTTKFIYTQRDFADAASAMAAMKKVDEWKRTTMLRPPSER